MEEYSLLRGNQSKEIPRSILSTVHNPEISLGYFSIPSLSFQSILSTNPQIWKTI
jgi:hypothetical protein